MRIHFYDITANKSYDAETLQNEPLGGTEATVIRVAEGLGALGHDVTVFQDKKETTTKFFATYAPLEDAEKAETPHAGICLRIPILLPYVKKKLRLTSKLILWCHDFNENDLVADYGILKDTNTHVVCVSRTQEQLFKSRFLASNLIDCRVTFIYNPIDDALIPDDTLKNQNKLVYFSSPHKGLESTLELFQKLREHVPEYELYISNPGYYQLPEFTQKNVTVLGSLPHPEVIKHVREAFCTFHMNEYPETFGLVYAESLAVGTPVLTSKCGATYEVITKPEFLIDVNNEKKVINRMLKWRKDGAPKAKMKEDFRLANVVKQWETLLEKE